MKKFFGMIVIIIGVLGLLGSWYIKNEVKKGEQKISATEQQMDMGDKLLSLSPQLQEGMQGVTGSIQDKVQDGKEEVVFYTDIAKWLEVGGILFLVLGVGVLFCGKKYR